MTSSSSYDSYSVQFSSRERESTCEEQNGISYVTIFLDGPDTKFIFG